MLDRSKYGGGLLLYVRVDIPSKRIRTYFPPDIEFFFNEINSYNHHKNMIGHHIARELATKRYDNSIILGYFNSEVNDDCLKDFCDAYHFSSLIKEPTCFKNPKIPTCIDLIPTNRPSIFQNTTIMGTSTSDFH